MGASCDEPSEEEKQEVSDRLFVANGGIARIRPELVRKDAVNRQLAKLYLNSLWGKKPAVSASHDLRPSLFNTLYLGKFCQKPHTDNYTTIHGYAEFAALWNDPNLNRKKISFRYISSGTWKVKYHTFGDFAKANPKYNIYLSSKVTEVARCHLHRQMLRIGQDRIIYCDTDSIIFLWPKDHPKLDRFGLGQWVDELPGEIIKKVHALAPKFYHLELASEETMLKSKGIQVRNCVSYDLPFLYSIILDDLGKSPKNHGESLGKTIIGTVLSTNQSRWNSSSFPRYNSDEEYVDGSQLYQHQLRVWDDVDQVYRRQETRPGDFKTPFGVLYAREECGV